MGYITTEIVAEIRSELNATFPNFKFRCYREHHSTINIVIVSAPINFMEGQERDYVQVNHYRLEENFKGEVLEALQKIQAIVTKGQTHHETGDYGTQPSFYEHIYIGEYNKPFILTEKVAIGTIAPVSGDMAKIVHNSAKDGIEIYFPSKPNVAILDTIKSNGYRWGKFNKCWYARVSTRALNTAAKYGTLPPTLTPEALEAEHEAAGVSGYVRAQEQAYEDNFAWGG